MSINRYPQISGTAITYAGSGTNPVPAGPAIPPGLYQITSDSNYIESNILYYEDTTRNINYTTSITPYLFLLNDTRFYTATSRFAVTVAPTTLFYGNNLSLIGGSAGLLATSTDGITWTTRTSSFGSTTVKSITYGNGLFVASGNASRLATSTDGTTWTSRTVGSATTVNLDFVFGDGGQFFAYASSPQWWVSTNAITWATRAMPTGSAPNGMAYGASTFVLINTSDIYSSTDGITWTTRVSFPTSSGPTTVSFLNNLFFVGTQAASAGDPGKIYTSTNGITWTLRNTLPTSGGDYKGQFTYFSGRYAVFATSNAMSVSTDGINWLNGPGTGTTTATITQGSINMVNNGSKYIVASSSTNIGVYTLEKTGTSASLLYSDLGTIFSTVAAV